VGKIIDNNRNCKFKIGKPSISDIMISSTEKGKEEG